MYSVTLENLKHFLNYFRNFAAEFLKCSICSPFLQNGYEKKPFGTPNKTFMFKVAQLLYNIDISYLEINHQPTIRKILFKTLIESGFIVNKKSFVKPIRIKGK